jgi:hypothetical protein
MHYYIVYFIPLPYISCVCISFSPPNALLAICTHDDGHMPAGAPDPVSTSVEYTAKRSTSALYMHVFMTLDIEI